LFAFVIRARRAQGLLLVQSWRHRQAESRPSFLGVFFEDAVEFVLDVFLRLLENILTRFDLFALFLLAQIVGPLLPLREVVWARVFVEVARLHVFVGEGFGASREVLGHVESYGFGQLGLFRVFS